MRYAIVVKDITDEMYLKAYGKTPKIKLKRNTLFRFNGECLSTEGVLCEFFRLDYKKYPLIIPLEWCLELTEEEYNIFKRLEGKK